MELLLTNLAHGFGVALSFQNLTFALLGALIGTAIGVLPGIGPVATISLLLPITFGLPATGHDDLCAFGGKGKRGGAADSRSCASDECDFV